MVKGRGLLWAIAVLTAACPGGPQRDSLMWTHGSARKQNVSLSDCVLRLSADRTARAPGSAKSPTVHLFQSLKTFGHQAVLS